MNDGLEISVKSKNRWIIELGELARSSGLLSQQGTPEKEGANTG